jgi:hypothetical protein
MSDEKAVVVATKARKQKCQRDYVEALEYASRRVIFDTLGCNPPNAHSDIYFPKIGIDMATFCTWYVLDEKKTVGRRRKRSEVKQEKGEACSGCDVEVNEFT